MAPMRLFFHASMTNKQEYQNDCVLARHFFSSSLKLAPITWSVWCCFLCYTAVCWRFYTTALFISSSYRILWSSSLRVTITSICVSSHSPRQKDGGTPHWQWLSDLWCSSFTRVLNYLLGCCGWLLMFGVQVTCGWDDMLRSRGDDWHVAYLVKLDDAALSPDANSTASSLRCCFHMRTRYTAIFRFFCHDYSVLVLKRVG